MAVKIPDNIIKQSQKQIEQEQRNQQTEQNLEQQQNQKLIINRILNKKPDIKSNKQPSQNLKLKSRKNSATNHPARVCFKIHQIDIKPKFKLDSATQQKLYQNYLNHCLTIADINQLIKKITQYYVKLGFITTKAGLKLGSNLKTGVLKIQLQVGKVDDILLDFYPTKAANHSKTVNFPAIKNKPLNISAIEQGLEQINSLVSQKATMKITPAANKASYSDIAVTIKQVAKPHEVSLVTNNYGSETTGKNPLTLKLYFEDLAYMSDKITLSLKNDTKQSPLVDKDNISQNINFSFSLPLGWDIVTYSYNKTKFVQQLKGRVQTFTSSSNSQTSTLDIMRNIFRNKKHKLSIGGSLALYETESYVNDALVEVSSRKMTNFALKFNYLIFLTGGYLSANLKLAKGLDSLGATKDNIIRDGTPKIQYQLDKLTINYVKNIGTSTPINLTAGFTYQNAYSELLATEQCVVGGTGSVAGFEINKISEENCWFVNSKLSTKIFKWFGMANPYLQMISAGVNLDYGVGKSYFKGESHTLIGWGYHLDFNHKNIQFSYNYGEPVNKPKIFEDKVQYPKTDVGNVKIDLTLKYRF